MKEDKEEMLDGAESQNYGYGYGTKVGIFILSICVKFNAVLSKLINKPGH